MPWVMYDGKWIEVFEDAHSSGLSRCYYAVDARITRQPFSVRIYNSKPDWEPMEPVGEKVVVNYKRVIQMVEECERSHFHPYAAWGEIDDIEDCFVVSVEITEVQGYEHTHLCEYCEEYATTNPHEKAPCRGCGQVGYWDEWPGEAPKLGLVEPPDWAQKLIDKRR